MSYFIKKNCITCGLCIAECPEGAITEDTPYIIDPALCTECGACAEVCPVDSCQLLPATKESA